MNLNLSLLPSSLLKFPQKSPRIRDPFLRDVNQGKAFKTVTESQAACFTASQIRRTAD